MDRSQQITNFNGVSNGVIFYSVGQAGWQIYTVLLNRFTSVLDLKASSFYFSRTGLMYKILHLLKIY
jgi:hypothetical protein